MRVEASPIAKSEEKPDVVDLFFSLRPSAAGAEAASLTETVNHSSSNGGHESAEDNDGVHRTLTLPEAPATKGPGWSKSLLAFHQKRYDYFLQAYFGYGMEQRTKCIRQAAQMCMIGLGLQKKSQTRSGDMVHAMRRFLRHSVLAVEGDAVFVKLVQKARPRWCDEGNEHFDDPRHWPNARCIALHYGLPSLATKTGVCCPDANTETLLGVKPETELEDRKFPAATLMAVVATTPIEEGESVRLCLRSYNRCIDEALWYEELFGPRCNEGSAGAASVTRGQKRFDMWPEGLAFFHGVGSRHAGAHPVAGFPFTLLDLIETREIGEGQKGLFAAHPVPYATCFLYCGPAVATKVVEERRVGAAVKNSTITTAAAAADATTTTTTNSNDATTIVSASSALASNFTTTTSCDNMTTNNTNNSNSDNEDELWSGIPIHDATYALGLGQHGICFGQGLMRYANHRYNISRFGNVELCSVILSVTSEFSSLVAELERRRSSTSRKRRGKPRNSLRRRSNKSTSIINGKRGDDVMGAKRRRYRPLVGRRIFLEEHSHFVTVPFFIATTDIEEGQQLLAWTYGEEYDARLERQVVCDGNLVPYADAAVLDARVPVGRWQCYGGDYRHGMGVSDIVWCRQPSLNGFRDPVDDLFVVLDIPSHGIGYLLLRPLSRGSIAQAQALLEPHHKAMDEMILLDVCESKTLEQCIITHIDTVALLLVDMDYWTLKDAKRTPTSSPLAWNSCGCGGGSSCVIRHVVVDGTALRAATRLVLESKHVLTTTTNMRVLTGSVWPFLQGCDSATRPCGRKGMARDSKNRSVTSNGASYPL
ncbi:hypothetical protein TraAM80_03557 [Trypanosoma rangeli]|uniref:SET domain-containing protein n=1 Tax=Trypanosoma rangeli TaxID=5698 RepID=A0A3R7NJ02_TRYRA|nr:uncharacterized protein TraAM80_03557 [Trypanosoma rangeli]RNF07185.1 hypothetical protein TraAM80_03557 [Trypanosoma rangeli]|eukprot:RNF07185.1 hypothetical protein TraAM80_03557 [Trypanosoma rangeli]